MKFTKEKLEQIKFLQDSERRSSLRRMLSTGLITHEEFTKKMNA